VGRAEKSTGLTIAGVRVSLSLLAAQKLCQHLIKTCLAHRQGQLVSVQANYLATPTAPYQLIVDLSFNRGFFKFNESHDASPPCKVS
jgi:hypothetical protein